MHWWRILQDTFLEMSWCVRIIDLVAMNSKLYGDDIPRVIISSKESFGENPQWTTESKSLWYRIFLKKTISNQQNRRLETTKRLLRVTALILGQKLKSRESLALDIAVGAYSDQKFLKLNAKCLKQDCRFEAKSSRQDLFARDLCCRSKSNYRKFPIKKS